MTLLWTISSVAESGSVTLNDGTVFTKKAYADEQVAEFEKVSSSLCYLTEQHMDWRGSSYGDRVNVVEDEEDVPVTDAVIKDGVLVGFCPLRSPWDLENHKEKFFISLDNKEDKLTYHDPYPLFGELKEGESWETYTLISLIPIEESQSYTEN